MGAEAVTQEQNGIVLGIVIMLGIALVVLLQLHFRWSRAVDERQDELERRVKELEERG